MDTLEFIASIIDSLAWPLAIVVLIFILRTPLSKLIPFLERLKFKGLELDFTKRVHEVAAEAAAVLPEPVPQIAHAVEEELEELAAVYPRGAVLESWIKIERAAADAAKRRGLPLSSVDLKSPKRLIHVLEDAKVLDEKQAAVFDDLRNLRNAAAHASDLTLTASTAAQYVKATQRILTVLEPPSTGV